MKGNAIVVTSLKLMNQIEKKVYKKIFTSAQDVFINGPDGIPSIVHVQV